MSKRDHKLAIVCHLFYSDIAPQLVRKLQIFSGENITFFVNIQGDSPDHIVLQAEVSKKLHNCRIITTPNKGRDIGAKLFLVNMMLLLDSAAEFTLIIHDKNSPHLENSNYWRDNLFRVIEPKFLGQIFDVFKEFPEVGIVGSAKYIQNEYNESDNKFVCSSNTQIKEVLKKYDIHTKNYDFVAGNIFWIRTKILKTFFEKRSILKIRADLEMGNALDFTKGTYIHSWERIMSWIATSQGYSIYGI